MRASARSSAPCRYVSVPDAAYSKSANGSGNTMRGLRATTIMDCNRAISWARHHTKKEELLMGLKVLILGVNGFIGSSLTEHILRDTDWEVYGMDMGTNKLEG